MAISVKYNPELNCVLTSITGPLTPEVINEFFEEVGKVATAHECTRVLSDLRQAIINATTIDIYSMVKNLQSKHIDRSFRRAIVFSTDHEDYRFWETACRNEGYQGVQIFQDYDEARDWVLK